jgi:peptide subunit release factor 1 (eRF1)
MRPNERGRNNVDPFVRKELSERVNTFEAAGPERKSLDADAQRIREYLDALDASPNGLALFACSGADLFEAMPLAAPLEENRLVIGDQPHLYPLAKVLEQYPRYVAVLADTRSTRIFVFAANALEKAGQIEGTRTKRHKMGGWSQARYQRHVDNFHLHHAKEVVDALTRIVRDERIDKVIVAGDDVIVPLLREQMPKDIADRVIDVVKLDHRAAEHEILEASLASLRENDAQGDRQRVAALISAYRGNGLGIGGLEATRRAFAIGQVDELLLPAVPDVITGTAAEELVTLARQTSAKIRFIEDASLLRPIGGVGAFLRFRRYPAGPEQEGAPIT